MIFAHIIGGLGNQMFQYALTRSLANRNGGNFSLDVSDFELYKLHKYCLSQLSIVERVAPPDIGQWHRRRQGRKAALTRFLPPWKKIKFIKETNRDFNPRILTMTGDVYLEGYWQSEKYFSNIRNVLLKEFAPKNLDERARASAALIANADCPVSIHVRRGDYVSNKTTNQFHGTCDLEYYRRAAALINDRFTNPHYFVFSDDMAWSKQNMVLGDKVTYIDGNLNHEDLHLMSLCRHNIVANSSFSWWGAWLNDHHDKVVIAPKSWYLECAAESSDLVPKTWRRI